LHMHPFSRSESCRRMPRIQSSKPPPTITILCSIDRIRLYPR
jgi:hypothetical protein